jgi:hypothetical protein
MELEIEMAEWCFILREFFGPAVPEPSSIGLLGFALLSGALAFRKRLKNAC